MFVILATVSLLIVSNVFMTFAWYGHLGGQNKPTWSLFVFIADLHRQPLFLAVLVSWGIAFVEYLFQVPANRIGSTTMSKAQLKILQELISLSVFVVIALFYWREKIGWNYLWAGLCILAAVFFIFQNGPETPKNDPPSELQKQG